MTASDTRPTTASGRLIDEAIVVARVVSQALRLLEATPVNADVQKLALELAEHEDVRRAFVPLRSPDKRGEESDDLLARAMRLTVLSWRDIVWQPRSPHTRRPDVLRLVSRAMANPRVPETLSLTRFAIILALRSLYRVRHDESSLETLRQVQTALSARFEQQIRRRERKGSKSSRASIPSQADRAERLVLDVLVLDGWITRSLSPENRAAYYEAFLQHDLGVDRGRSARSYAAGVWPELNGRIPNFPTLLNLLFAQPTCVVGLDQVLGGLLPILSSEPETGGAAVTFIAGPAGSGKTTLSLSIASRSAELGATVRYISTEESAKSLRAKQLSTGGSTWLTDTLWPGTPQACRPEFMIYDHLTLPLASLKEILDQLSRELTVSSSGGEPAPDLELLPEPPLYAYLPISRLIVIDSVSALLRSDAPSQPQRLDLARTMLGLRSLGVAVILVGSATDATIADIDYLVDNVILLGVDDAKHAHSVRTLQLAKTRLQSAHRGRHVLHLSRSSGCEVSPSLHAVIREIHDRDLAEPNASQRAILFPGSQRQLGLPGIAESTPMQDESAITLRANASTLVYGRGPCGKARFALALAYEPRVAVQEDWETTLGLYPRIERVPGYTDARRVLVLSFLYERKYYWEHTKSLFKARFDRTLNDAEVASRLTVQSLYPGLIDPETVVQRVRRELSSAICDGVPYDAVVVDGIHNIHLQYPLLEREPLLWPGLARLLRSNGVDVVMTFTFFAMAQIDGSIVQQLGAEGVRSPLEVSRQTFFHLLVSTADYSFVVERPADTTGNDRDLARVGLASSIDGFRTRPGVVLWHPDAFRITAMAAPSWRGDPA